MWSVKQKLWQKRQLKRHSMNPKHKEIAETIYQTAIFALAETGKDAPIFFLIKDNQTIPILVPPGLDIDVTGYIMTSLELAKEHDADAIMIVAGMWVVTSNVNDIDLTIRPSEHDDKQHYLNLVYMSADGSELTSIAGKVETDPSGTKYVRDHEWLFDFQQFEMFEPWR
jgi:hypothetical protein